MANLPVWQVLINFLDRSMLCLAYISFNYLSDFIVKSVLRYSVNSILIDPGIWPLSYRGLSLASSISYSSPLGSFYVFKYEINYTSLVLIISNLSFKRSSNKIVCIFTILKSLETLLFCLVFMPMMVTTI